MQVRPRDFAASMLLGASVLIGLSASPCATAGDPPHDGDAARLGDATGSTASAAAASARTSVPDEASLRAADQEQVRILLEGDVAADDALLHPNFVANGDGARVLRKRQALERVARATQRVDRFERTVEAMTITDGVGIVTGREHVVAAEGSDLRREFGDAALERRFTNVYLFRDDRWRLLARQATPVAVRPAAPARALLLGAAPGK